MSLSKYSKYLLLIVSSDFVNMNIIEILLRQLIQCLTKNKKG